MNKGSFSSKVFAVLDHKLMKLDRIKHEKELLTKEAWFTRKARKLDFKEDMRILLSCGAASMKKELYEYFSKSLTTLYHIAQINKSDFKRFFIFIILHND